MHVRCQSIWVQGRLKLRDDLAHLVDIIMCLTSAPLGQILLNINYANGPKSGPLQAPLDSRK
jgi:hypothetical protein